MSQGTVEKNLLSFSNSIGVFAVSFTFISCHSCCNNTVCRLYHHMNLLIPAGTGDEAPTGQLSKSACILYKIQFESQENCLGKQFGHISSENQQCVAWPAPGIFPYFKFYFKFLPPLSNIDKYAVGN